MKSIISKFIFAALIVPMVFVGCSKDEKDEVEPQPKPSAEEKVFSFHKDGKQKDFTSTVVINSGGEQLTISANSGLATPMEMISVRFSDNLTPGEYDISNLQSGQTVYMTYSVQRDTTYEIYMAQSGTLKINSINSAEKKVSGTFDFNAKDLKNNKVTIVSNGKFNIK